MKGLRRFIRISHEASTRAPITQHPSFQPSRKGEIKDSKASKRLVPAETKRSVILSRV